jgi:hypothetical protein
MSGLGKNRDRVVLGRIAKSALFIGILAYGAATWLSTVGLETGRLGRLVAQITETDEPLTTGSIRHEGSGLRLDPCVVLRP